MHELLHDVSSELQGQAAIGQRLRDPSHARLVLRADEGEVVNDGVRDLVAQLRALDLAADVRQLAGVGAQRHRHDAGQGGVADEVDELVLIQPVTVLVILLHKLFRLGALQRGDAKDLGHVLEVVREDGPGAVGVEQGEGVGHHVVAVLACGGAEFAHDLVKDLLHLVDRGADLFHRNLNLAAEGRQPLLHLVQGRPHLLHQLLDDWVEVLEQLVGRLPQRLHQLGLELLGLLAAVHRVLVQLLHGLVGHVAAHREHRVCALLDPGRDVNGLCQICRDAEHLRLQVLCQSSRQVGAHNGPAIRRRAHPVEHSRGGQVPDEDHRVGGQRADDEEDDAPRKFFLSRHGPYRELARTVR
mmetsp:Transcript_79191/g.222015  ORF Transcript_79191/g.222015 Transcript_79191/m.222015 type:complete len:356 (+) Transcript_79191:597-1664(+)